MYVLCRSGFQPAGSGGGKCRRGFPPLSRSVADAEAMARKFEETVKPRYQRAYDNYLADLEIIKVTGRANDDENLYDDLRKMNSNEFFVYSQSERGINLNRGNAFR